MSDKMHEDVILIAAEPPPPPSVPPALNTLQTVSLLVIATIMCGAALSYTRSMMIPFVFALFLSYFVAPAVSFLRTKIKFPQWLAIATAMSAVLFICLLFFLVMQGSIERLIGSFSQYEERVAQVTQDLVNFAARFDVKLNQTTVLAKVRELPIFSYLHGAASVTLSFLGEFLLVMTFLVFLISGRKIGEPKAGLASAIDKKIRTYILTKILSNVVGALAVYLVYLSLDLDLSLMFAMLCFVLGFIPTLGSVVATLLPLPIAYLQYEENWAIWMVIVLPITIQTILGNFVEPKFIGRGLDLHPVTILLSLMFWGIIWGIAGMFLAVPITAVLKIILDRHPLTAKFSDLLAGKSPF
jgi:AI-2 transport protein TqsA